MSLLTAGGIVVALLLAAAAYLRAVRHLYRLRGERPERQWVQTADGWRIAVHQRKPAVRRFREPVLLCHGLATNHLNLDFDPPYSLARAFAEAGFQVVSLDWRGAGASRPPPGRGRFDYDADDLITQDAPAVMEWLLRDSGAEELFWVGHSLGGLVGYAVLGGAEGHRVRGLCALGSPVYFHYPRWLVRADAGLYLAGLAGGLPPAAGQPRLRALGGPVTLPLSDVLINPKAMSAPVLRLIYANLIESMGYRLLRQLEDWTAHDRFCSRDGAMDYRARLASRPAAGAGAGRDAGWPGAAVGHCRPGRLLGSPTKR